jgi:hypothetical protein
MRFSLLNVRHLRVSNFTLNLGGMFRERSIKLLYVVKGLRLVLINILISVKHLLLLSL